MIDYERAVNVEKLLEVIMRGGDVVREQWSLLISNHAFASTLQCEKMVEKKEIETLRKQRNKHLVVPARPKPLQTCTTLETEPTAWKGNGPHHPSQQKVKHTPQSDSLVHILMFLFNLHYFS